MERSRNMWMEIELVGITLDDVDRVELVAQQYRDGGVRKRGFWKSDGSGDCKNVDGDVQHVYWPWTREETRSFARGEIFWVDARPVTAQREDFQAAPVEVLMEDSLFTATDFEEGIA